MKNMKSTRARALTLSLLACQAVSLALMASTAHAQLAVEEPLVSLVAPGSADGAYSATFSSTSPAQVLELSLVDAKALLASTEGSAWKVFGVNAPDCSAADMKTVRKLKKHPPVAEGCESPVKQKAHYVYHKVPGSLSCAAMKRDCTAAEKFSSKFGIHASCSSLYSRTTVLLSTDTALQQN